MVAYKSLIRINRTGIVSIGLVLASLVLLSGCFEEYDLDPPIVGTVLSEDVLYVEVIDVQSEVERVDITAGFALSQSYLSGFRSIVVDLGQLDEGLHTIRIRAEDAAGNLTIESVRYERTDYVTDTQVLKRTYEPVADAWGNEVAVLEAVHRRTTCVASESDVPPREDKNEHFYCVHNTSRGSLYDVSATVTAYDLSGAVLWLHRVVQGTLSPGDCISSGIVSDGAHTPVYYSVSMSWW